ncbi:hypothetical protein MTR_3g452960 [Medicago truncatula]|uniref:Uncharacterized protein n=1 Tax=Medicago truncatula TaxID=3880 RepID=A0A072V6K9_MEDTR|nr:hypothetical protein MTR_3g452960 [Medicago truncatula]
MACIKQWKTLNFEISNLNGLEVFLYLLSPAKLFFFLFLHTSPTCLGAPREYVTSRCGNTICYVAILLRQCCTIKGDGVRIENVAR